MHAKPSLNSSDVDAIIANAKAEAAKNHWAVSIAVVDDGGHLTAPARLFRVEYDGARNLRVGLHSMSLGFPPRIRDVGKPGNDHRLRAIAVLAELIDDEMRNRIGE